MNNFLKGFFIGIALVVAGTLVHNSLTSYMSRPVMHTECSIIATEEMENSLITANKINCPEGKYRCFFTLRGASCSKIGDNL